MLKASEWVVACLTDKANKQTYPQPCILLVQVEPERPLNTREWLTIIENIQSSVNGEAFTATYLVNAWRNVVLQVYQCGSRPSKQRAEFWDLGDPTEWGVASRLRRFSQLLEETNISVVGVKKEVAKIPLWGRRKCRGNFKMISTSR